MNSQLQSPVLSAVARPTIFRPDIKLRREADRIWIEGRFTEKDGYCIELRHETAAAIAALLLNGITNFPGAREERMVLTE